MKKLISLLLALCMLLAALPVWAEETDLLDLVFDGIESFDPDAEEVLDVPEDTDPNSKLAVKTDCTATYLTRVDVSYEELCTDEETTYMPAAALILDTLAYTGNSFDSVRLTAYAAVNEYYEQLMVVVLDYTNDHVKQLWWTPGTDMFEYYRYYDDNDQLYTVNGFLNSDYAWHIDEMQKLNSSTLSSYVGILTGTSLDPLKVGKASYRISDDKQSIFIDKPSISGGSGKYSIAYNIYDSDSQPVNYFYSTEEHVAATPGYGGLFNVFIVVTDTVTGETNTQNIDWHTLNWPYADTLTVGKVSFEISPNKKSIYLNRPSVACKSGAVTIAYNIYDEDSNPVNYFYSTFPRVAATPGYAGKFNVFVVVTDTGTGEQVTQDIGWQTLGSTAAATYRALVVGNSTFTNTNASNLICCKYDAEHMDAMLSTINGGAYKGNVTVLHNATPTTLSSAIASTFSDAQANDVSLFYISSHGVVYEDDVSPEYGGAVLMSNGQLVRWNSLASWLNSANPSNKVIVLVDTCGSGSSITSAGASAMDETLAARAIASAFAAVDPGVTVKGMVKDENGQLKLGELRTNKFEVITACRADETSLGGSTGSLFTNHLVAGIGSDSSMPADTDGDKCLTTQELYTYTYNKCQSYHHPVVWPANSSYVLFWR